MALTQEERDILIEIRTTVDRMDRAMTTANGESRCTQHKEQLDTIFKRVDRAAAWAKAIIISVIGGGVTLGAVILAFILNN